MRTCRLVFGALSKPLRTQLREHGIKIDNVVCLRLQQDADAITRLAIRQLMTERETESARGRLAKLIERECREGSERKG